MDIGLVIMLAVLGVAMYFMMIRPARKQQQKQQQMMSSLDVGSRVMLGSGIYGTIRHLGEKQAVIEISPGVDLTILRAAIRSSVAPDDEEFEYSDDASEPGVAEGMEAFEADMASPFAPPTDAEDVEQDGDQADQTGEVVHDPLVDEQSELGEDEPAVEPDSTDDAPDDDAQDNETK